MAGNDKVCRHILVSLIVAILPSQGPSEVIMTSRGPGDGEIRPNRLFCSGAYRPSLNISRPCIFLFSAKELRNTKC